MAYRNKSTNAGYEITYTLFALVLGMFMAWITGDIGGRGIFGSVLSHYGIWIFASSLIGYYSRDTLRSGISVFAYCAGAVLAYTVCVYLASGGVDLRLFVYRIILSVIGALIGIISFNARQREWIGGICGAAATSLLVAEGYPAFYSRSFVLILDLIMACVLYLLLVRSRDKRLMGLPFVIIFSFALIFFDAFNRIFGGWIS